MLRIVGHSFLDGDGRGNGQSSSDHREMERFGEDDGTIDADVVELLLDRTICCPRLWLLRFKGLVELKKVGLFACAIIKKCRYWPAYVPSNAMIEAFAEAQVGDSMAMISGTRDGREYFL